MSRRWFWFASVLAAGLLLCTAMSVAEEAPRYVRAVVGAGPGDLLRLGAAGIPVEEGYHRAAGQVELVLSPAEVARLRAEGFTLSILDGDVTRTYAERARRDARSIPLQASSAVPHFHLGSMGGFLTLAELEAEVDSMRAAFPLLISRRETLGVSIENRPLWAVRISRNPDVDEQEPRALYTALHHAREPQGMMTLVHTMWYLLERYGVDEDVTAILDHRELYFLPAVNPDGYVYNQSTSADGGGMWRKNRRQNADGSVGVDLNRNYGVAWGYDNVGSSGTPVHDSYRGTGPFSEPEVVAIRELCMRKQFSVALNHHSYGNVLIHPWGHRNAQTPDSVVFRRLAGILTSRSYYAYGTGMETIGYATNGDSDDWMYGDTLVKPMIYSMTPEIGGADDGFWPSPAQIAPIAERNLHANLSMARLAGECYAVELAAVNQREDNDTVSLSLSLRSVGVRNVSSGVTVHFEQPDSRPVYPPSAFVSTASPSPFHVRLLRDKGKAEGSWMDLHVRLSAANDCSRDSIRFRIGVPVTVIRDTVDTLGGKWVAVSTLAGSNWDTSSTWAYSGRLSYTDSPQGEYQRSFTSVLTLAKPVRLAGSAAELRFRGCWDIEAEYDVVVVEASSDQGRTWSALEGKYTRPGSGAVGSKQVLGVPGLDRLQREWVEEVMDLRDYVGGELLLRFRLDTDAFVQRDGIFVDDITILLYSSAALSVPAETAPAAPYLFQNYPNPFNGETQIRFTLGQRGENAQGERRVTVRVFDLLGREVSTVVDRPFSSGNHVVTFTARGLASGVYLYRLQDGAHAATRPMIILR
jgi:carboxypeptidase T